ncbi:hypothetical protein J2R76_004021 [Bradyrhizobium sp. USDA 4532]|uniref:hypothetical protein n=1 Tax=unclassified Bradyrhizobium TaxID=2631580 RepID=UPI00209C6F32|nr:MULTISPECIES: hypothetical protein [unclassified Bradyrhizobium]MCP1835681.1 hypothetical protein [Bradyrhizobium sp. USDA 4545]MCP1920430.1 hypothetical protein [Bradyrhizobium sp. USDA 4532]
MRANSAPLRSKAAKIELAQQAEAFMPISTLIFRTAIQFTINAILGPTDCKKLQSRSGFAADRLAAHLETVAPFACRRFSNAKLHASVLHRSFSLITAVCASSLPRRPECRLILIPRA